MHKKLSIHVVLLCLFAGICSGCSKSPGKSEPTAATPTDSEQKIDSESGSETGTRGDTATETGNTGTDTRVVVDTDSASDSADDTGTDTDTDTDTDTTVSGTDDTGTGDDSADTGSDTDTENPWLPPGCEIVTSYRGDWTGENAFYGDMMVWGEQTPSDCQVITVRKLSTKEHISVTDCDYMHHFTIWKNYVYWDKQLDGADSFSRELFRANISTKIVEQLTDNDTANNSPFPGNDYLVFLNQARDGTGYIQWLDFATRKINTITADSRSNPPGYDFDGERWVVWVYNDVAYKYDIVDRLGPTVIDPVIGLSTWPRIADNKVYSGSWTQPVDPINHCDVHIHDLATGQNAWAFTKPYDQIAPTASGDVVAYLTTEELGTGWLSDPVAHVEIFDLKTGVSRRITNLPEVYYATGLNGKYLAWGGGSRTLFLCDLEEGGFIDASGHVIPEGIAPDAGVDAGSGAGRPSAK